MSVCLLSVYLSIDTYPPVYLSTCRPVCLPLRLPVCLSTCLSSCLSVYLYPVGMFTCLPVYLSTCLTDPNVFFRPPTSIHSQQHIRTAHCPAKPATPRGVYKCRIGFHATPAHTWSSKIYLANDRSILSPYHFSIFLPYH